MAKEELGLIVVERYETNELSDIKAAEDWAVFSASMCYGHNITDARGVEGQFYGTCSNCSKTVHEASIELCPLRVAHLVHDE